VKVVKTNKVIEDTLKTETEAQLPN